MVMLGFGIPVAVQLMVSEAPLILVIDGFKKIVGITEIKKLKTLLNNFKR